MKRLALTTLLLLLLTACTPAPTAPTTTPVPPENTPTSVPSLEATPTQTTEPTKTVTPLDTATATLIPCFTLIEPVNGVELSQTGLIRFSWNSQPGADHYQLEITLPNGTVEIYKTENLYFDKYLASFPLGGEYSWLVRAFDENEQDICITLPNIFMKDQTVLAPNDIGTNEGDEEEDEEEVSSDSCFLAGTLILMGDQSHQPIEEVQVGDIVMSYDLEMGELVQAEVLEVESPLREAYYVMGIEDGSSLRITGEHPVYIRKNDQTGWGAIAPEQAQAQITIDIMQLAVGDFVMSADGDWFKIVDIVRIDRVVRTYNLSQVSSTSVFFADGWLVHNKGGEDDDSGDQ